MKKQQKILFIAFVFLLPAFPAYVLQHYYPVKAASVTEKDPFMKEWQDMEDLVDIVIDSRTPTKFEQSHIPGALNFNFINWEDGLQLLFEKYSPGMTILVYCSSDCSTSRNVAERLRADLGTDKVFYLKGGLDSWQELQK